MSDVGSENSVTRQDTDDIISAIRRIMAAEQDILDDDPEVNLVSEAARTRIFAALDRLTGKSDHPPTVLEALILEKLDPLLSDWIDQNLPALVERLVRDEIRRLASLAEQPAVADRPLDE